MGDLENRPYIVSWNLTKRCNLLCPHCYINAVPDSTEELSTDEAMLVIDELTYLNHNLMLILTGGEPMLRRDIFDIVSYASESGFITVMGSNGTVLDRQSITALKEAGLKGIGISIDSVQKEYHDTFRGLEGSWEASIETLRYAYEEGIETQIDITLTDRNIHEIDAIVELGVTLRVRAVNFFFLVCTGRAMKTEISTENYEEALKKILKLYNSEKRLMIRVRCAPHIYKMIYETGSGLYKGSRGCLAGRHYMRIDPEGNVTPCPYMDLKLGSIKENSLIDIWENSPELDLLRLSKYEGRCGICEYREICGGCRARAYVETGDLLGEDSLCRYIPRRETIVRPEESIDSSLKWEPSAAERVKRIPAFMRGKIIRMIEAKALERGIKTITTELIDEFKGQGHHEKLINKFKNSHKRSRQ
ncbi:MAG: radical SAM protein [Nitrospirae bacterium]|nr:radical SAM protein [Nitrospirota bacterium]